MSSAFSSLRRSGLLWRAFWRALLALGEHLAAGAVAYLATGAMVGALICLFIAEAIGISANRIPAAAEGKGDS